MNQLENQPTEWIFTEAEVIHSEGQMIEVSPINQSGCSNCSAKEGCGTSALAKLFGYRSRKPLKLENTLGAKAGQKVLLSIKQSQLVQHSVMAYGLPLITLMMAAWLVLTLTHSDLLSTVGGFLGLMLGWWLTHKIYRPVLPNLEKILE